MKMLSLLPQMCIFITFETLFGYFVMHRLLCVNFHFTGDFSLWGNECKLSLSYRLMNSRIWYGRWLHFWLSKWQCYIFMHLFLLFFMVTSACYKLSFVMTFIITSSVLNRVQTKKMCWSCH
jgi:hypothetical protein